MKHFYNTITMERRAYEDNIDTAKYLPQGYVAYEPGQEPQELLDAMAYKSPEEAYQDKWSEYDLYQSTLTVTAVSDNKYDVSKSGLIQVIAKRDSVTESENFLWVETWGSFTSNKVELQEVILEANRLLQIKIDTLFGAV